MKNQKDKTIKQCRNAALLFCSAAMSLFMLFLPEVCFARDDTTLMFVGEELKVMTIASGREEGAWGAPAIANVITKDEIDQSGASTLADILNSEPGFLISDSETGYNSYLRGISDSVLFLNEAVPTGSKLNKSYNRINPYLSLESVKRIEIIKGPGSVLWGSDAFAGIVNIVPMTGKDFQGIKAGLGAGNSVKEKEAYLNWGRENAKWDSFLSLSAGEGKKYKPEGYNFIQFWGDESIYLPVSPDDRYGNGCVDNPQFFEASANVGLGDQYKLSTNISFYSKPYTRFDDPDNTRVWKEENEALSGFVKLEGNHKYNITSGIRWTGYVSWFDTQTQIVDLTLEDENRVYFGEIVHEKSLLNGDGLFTTGVSVRQEEVEDLGVWDSYYPDYFTDDNGSFLPWLHLYDYSSTTFSLFGQYRQTVGDVDMWAGIRGDDHEQSGSNVSYNTGVSWHPRDQWIYKASYGNAFRTPVAKQLQEGRTDMENIETLSIQAAWRPSKKGEVDITGYTSRLRDGYVQDPALGLSEPNDQDFYGIELNARYSPLPALTIGAGFSWVNNSGDVTHFRYNDYSYWEDGEIIDHYIDIYEPYDYGARILFNADVSYRITKEHILRAGCRYTGEREARYLLNEDIETYPDVWIFDAGLKVLNIFNTTLDADFFIQNLSDRNYEQPGIFGPVEGEPFSIWIKIEKTW